MSLEKATFGAGCFWGVESAFREIPGVVDAAVGYEGGAMQNPTYHDVCTDETGHAEVVEVQYDPLKVSYDQLLDLFWKIHDPTTLNRQGADAGTQYRSAIFFNSPAQRETAQRAMEEVAEQGLWSDPIVTSLEPLEEFYPAEEYHQRYFERNATTMYCQAVIAPKLAKVRAAFAERMQEPEI